MLMAKQFTAVVASALHRSSTRERPSWPGGLGRYDIGAFRLGDGLLGIYSGTTGGGQVT